MTEDEQVIYISWSKLRAWLHCKQHAFLMNKVKSPAKDVRVFFKGTVTDRILRDWLLEESPQSGAMVDRVEQYIEEGEQEHKNQGTGVVRWKYATDKADTIDWCKELLTKVEPIMYQLVVPYSSFPDYRFKAPVTVPNLQGIPTPVYLQGAMDILTLDDKGYAIYDLKATSNPTYWKKTIMQLVFYDLGLQAHKNSIPYRTALIQPMCDEQVLNLSVTDEHRTQLLSAITSYAHSVWRKDFAPKADDAGCSYCPVKSSCEKFTALRVSGRVSWT